MSVEVVLRVNEQGQLQIPDHIQRQLFPGMEVVLRFSDDSNGATSAENGLKYNDIAPATPGLVRENGILVFRGAIEEGFDWDAFMQEDREAPLHPYEPDQR